MHYAMSNLANSANLLFLSAKNFCKSPNIINSKNYMCKKKSTVTKSEKLLIGCNQVFDFKNNCTVLQWKRKKL